MHIQEILIFLEKHIVLSGIWILLLMIVLYTTINHWLIKSFLISCEDAIFFINKKNAIIIDARHKHDYYSGHIINSINLSIEKIKNNDIYELKQFKQTPLIIVHNYNTVAHSIKKHLNQLGFKKIYILQGGINSWKISNLPLLYVK